MGHGVQRLQGAWASVKSQLSRPFPNLSEPACYRRQKRWDYPHVCARQRKRERTAQAKGGSFINLEEAIFQGNSSPRGARLHQPKALLTHCQLLSVFRREERLFRDAHRGKEPVCAPVHFALSPGTYGTGLNWRENRERRDAPPTEEESFLTKGLCPD